MSYQFSTSTHSDDTILETFVESLLTSSFPNEIRRVLEHLKFLNGETDADVEEWRRRQDDCLDEVKRAVFKYREGCDADEVGDEQVSSVRSKRKRSADDEVEDKKRASTEDEAMKDDNGNDKPSAKLDRPPTVPTNEEILSHLARHNPQIFEKHDQISNMHSRLKQLSSERIQTAHQLRGMVDLALGRLHRDLEAIEKELGIVHKSTSIEAPCAAAATSASLEPSSVRAHAPSPLAGATSDKPGVEKSNNRNSHKNNLRRASSSTASSTTPHPASLSRSNSVALPVSTSAGTFSAQRPKDLAAIKVKSNTSEWILAKILSYDKSSKMYTLSDEDMTEDKMYTIPSTRVIPLNKTISYSRGESVYAVYPDTTSFYPARVTSSKNNFVMVHFTDDGDIHGITHEKAVPVWLVMRVPGK